MEVTFLGTGSAFSPESFNAGILIDRRVLLDAGAPLCVQLSRVGAGLDSPRAVLLTHFHADHAFGLAWLAAGRAVRYPKAPPLRVFGPPGSAAYVRQLLDLAWGAEVSALAREGGRLPVIEVDAGQRFAVDAYSARAYGLIHDPQMASLGYVVEGGGVRLGYTGDSQLCPGLDALLSDCDHVISEMSLAEPGALHLARADIESLMEAHPTVRFILTHHSVQTPVRGAVLARDLATLELPLAVAVGARGSADALIH